MYDSNVLSSPCMRAGVQRTCVCAFKERLKGGETSRRKRRGVLTMCMCLYMCVCLKRNIFLYYYSHRAYFSYPPTCIPGGWVCSFSPCLSFSSRVLSLSLSLFLPPLLFSDKRERFNPERKLFPFYARIVTRNCVVRPAAHKNRGNGAHLLNTLLLFLLHVSLFSLFLFL